MLLDGFSSMPCKEALPPIASGKGALWSHFGCGLTRGQGTYWVWQVMPLLGPGQRPRCRRGRGGRNTWDRPLWRGGCYWGNGKMIGHQHIPSSR